MPKKKKSKNRKKIKKRTKRKVKKKSLKNKKVVKRNTLSNKKKQNKKESSSVTEFIIKTKPEWIKSSLANKAQYLKKYKDSIKNFNKIKLVSELNNFCKYNKIKGTILIANEGINGTVAGLNKDINNLIIIFKNFAFFNLKIKFSYSKFMPFQKLKIKQTK